MIGLTSRMAECLAFIKTYKAADNYSGAPTLEEIRVGIGLSSKGEVYRLLSALEARGHIRRLRFRRRAIEIVCPEVPGRTVEQLTDIICGEVWRRLRGGEKVTVENLRAIVRAALS